MHPFVLIALLLPLAINAAAPTTSVLASTATTSTAAANTPSIVHPEYIVINGRRHLCQVVGSVSLTSERQKSMEQMHRMFPRSDQQPTATSPKKPLLNIPFTQKPPLHPTAASTPAQQPPVTTPTNVATLPQEKQAEETCTVQLYFDPTQGCVSPHGTLRYYPSEQYIPYTAPQNNKNLNFQDYLWYVARDAQTQHNARYVCYHKQDKSYRYYPNGIQRKMSLPPKQQARDKQ